MRISDWSSDVCSSDLPHPVFGREEVVPALAMATQSQTVPLAVLRMHLLDPPAPALDVFVGRNGEDAAQMFGPIDGAPAHVPVPETLGRTLDRQGEPLLDRKSGVEGKRVSVRVDPGGRRINKKKKD